MCEKEFYSVLLKGFGKAQLSMNPRPIIMFAWKMVAEMAENWYMGKGPPNITSYGSFETVGSGNLI